jgi:hypothetical protein
MKEKGFWPMTYRRGIYYANTNTLAYLETTAMMTKTVL